MKTKYLSLIAVLCMFFLIAPTVRAEFRTITVDGQTDDWDGIQPLVVDAEDDCTYDSEDIKAVYVANDGVNLYFWMELYPWTGKLSADFVSTTTYYFYIDIIPGDGDPTRGDTDYVIKYHNGVTTLCKYSHWFPHECEGLEGAMIDNNIEVSVPWDCIGGQECFSCFFMAESDFDGTDYAPDKVDEEIVTIGYCPCEPPVGGEILPLNWMQMTMPYAILILVAVTVLASLKRKKMRQYYPL